MTEQTCDRSLERFWEILTKGYCGGVQLAEILDEEARTLDDGPVRSAAADLALKVRGGTSLSKAMAMHPDVFSRAHVALVEGGELLGMVERVLPFILEAHWRCPTCGNLQMPGTRKPTA